MLVGVDVSPDVAECSGELSSLRRRRLLIGVLPALVVPFAGALVYFILLAGSPTARLVYAATKVFTVVWPIIALWGLERRPWPGGPWQWRRHLRSLPLGILSGLMISGLIILLFLATPVRDYVSAHADSIGRKVADFGLASPAAYMGFCVFLAASHSLIEEYYWRWYVFGRLAAVLPFKISVVVSSFAFAAHHYVILGAFFSPAGAVVFGTGVAVGGAIWCWMYRRSGSLAGCWLSHALVDAGILTVGYQVVFVNGVM